MIVGQDEQRLDSCDGEPPAHRGVAPTSTAAGWPGRQRPAVARMMKAVTVVRGFTTGLDGQCPAVNTIGAPGDPPREASKWRQGLFRGGSSPAAPHSSSWSERHWTSRALQQIGEIVSHSSAGVLAGLSAAGWAVLGLFVGFPHWWETVLYSVTASVTFVMVFVIQHTNARQTSATQRKLDELIRSSPRADDRLVAAEEAPDQELQALADGDAAHRERVQGAD